MSRVIPGWDEVYHEDGTDALIDLCDAMADGGWGINAVRPAVVSLCHACKGAWILPGVLAQPIVEELAHAAVDDRNVNLAPYQARLAAVAFQMAGKLQVPASALAMLAPDEFAFLLARNPIEVVAA